MPTPIAVPKYGDEVTDLSGNKGVAKYDPNTGAELTAGQAYKGIDTLPSAQATSAPSVVTYKGADNNLYDQATGALVGPAPVNESDYRNQVLDRFQKEIDATNSIYADKLNEAKTQGISSLGSARAIAAARGELGTDVGEAQKGKVITANNSIENGIRDEQQVKIAEIMGNADTIASNEIATKNAAAKQGIDAYLKNIQDKPTRVAASLQTLAQSMIDGNTKPDDYGDANLQKLAQSYGVTSGDILSAYNTAKIASDAAKAKAAKDSETTLSEGQVIVDGEGNVIAKGAEKTSPAYEEYQNYVSDEKSRGNDTPLSFDQYQTQDANRKARISAAASAGVVSTAQANIALKLSDDYEARSKDFYSVRDNYNKVIASAADPSAAGDLSLIFAYMKTLDPTSVVREGEFATAANAGSIPNTILAKYNKVVSGERLSPDQRSDFVDRSKKLYDAAEAQQTQTNDEFSARAAQYNVPPSLVVRSTNATGEDQGFSVIDPTGTTHYFPNQTAADAFKKEIGQ